MSVSGRQTRVAFARFHVNSWGAAETVNKGIYFETDGDLAPTLAFGAFESFNNAHDSVNDTDAYAPSDLTFSGARRFDDFGYVWDALAMGSPAIPTISSSLPGQTAAWQHVIDLADVIDGFGLTLAVDRQQYVEELTSGKVHGFRMTHRADGIMRTEYKTLAAKATHQSVINTRSTVNAAMFPALMHRIFTKQGVFRLNPAAVGSLTPGDAVTIKTFEFDFDRPQDEAQIFDQDFIGEPLDGESPHSTLSLTFSRMNTVSANSLYAKLTVFGGTMKADLTFTGAAINTADHYLEKWEWPALELNQFTTPTSGPAQVQPRARFRAVTAPTSVAGMPFTTPFRLTRVMTQSAQAILPDGPPQTPTIVSPANGGTNAGTRRTLTWAEVNASVYDVYFGTLPSPPLVSTGQGAATYLTPSLTPGTVYYWQIVARNVLGAASGPVWSFTATTYAPAAAPTLALGSGTGLGAGLYKYAYTDVTAAGESLPSPLASITTSAGGIPNPAAWGWSAFGLGVGSMVTNLWYDYSVSFVDAGGGETVPTAAANVTLLTGGATGSANTGLPISPSSLTVGRNVYRSSGQAFSALAAADTHKLVGTIANNTSRGPFVDGLADGARGVTAPTVNTTTGPGLEQVAISVIAAGSAGTTGRNLYRTAVGGSQLKLLQTIADNSTTAVTDATGDGSLGANAPTVDTSGL